MNDLEVKEPVSRFHEEQRGFHNAMSQVFVTRDTEDPTRLKPGTICKAHCEHGDNEFCTECKQSSVVDETEERLVPRA
jgi:hypothetical protein